MKKVLFVSIPVLFIVGFFALAANADDTLARFDGGIGSIPLRSGGRTNDVRGIDPGGRPWVISDLEAEVETNGDIKVEGEGLLLGGGGGVGTTGRPPENPREVFATLLCENAEDVEHNSVDVPVEANGDFRIDDVLDPVPPNPCDNPVLLIRSSGSGSWFAAGILKVD